jgi:hypothetical protein
MKETKFKVEAGTHGNLTSSAWTENTEDLPAAVVRSVIQDIALDIQVTVNGVTAPLAYWMDPDHWETDWEQLLDGATFEEYVENL